MSLTLRAPSSDRGHTKGLCGTYDGLPDNDFQSTGGATLEDVQAFISEWRSVMKKKNMWVFNSMSLEFNVHYVLTFFANAFFI